jgi:DNA-binding Xre family transcriptional regulator
VETSCKILPIAYIASMTINNKKLKLVENHHQEKTMANLSKLLKDNDMSQVELAKQLGRDKTTVNRWVKNSREVAWDNAVEIAKVLNCHPVDIIEGGKSEILLKQKCYYNGTVVDLPKEEQIKIPISYELNKKDVKVILIEARGTPCDGEIWVFNVPRVKTFCKNAIGKVCYLELINSKSTKKFLCLLSPNGDGTLKLVNNRSKLPIADINTSLNPYDFKIATPVRAKYDPNPCDC